MNEETKRVAANIATFFGVGRAPTAPGTVASIVALAIAVGLAYLGGRGLVLLAAASAMALGAWASEIYVRTTGKDDPSECVIDEVAGQWLACAFVPWGFWGYAIALLLFRGLDIAKPWPISRLEKLHGGVGVMADDVAAGLAAGLLIALLVHIGLL